MSRVGIISDISKQRLERIEKAKKLRKLMLNSESMKQMDAYIKKLEKGD